jgi:putative solute:sodium symporter small subunit
MIVEVKQKFNRDWNTMAENISSEHTQGEHSADYLESEVNILAPSTPFMREHLRIIWIMFATWAIIVFGPVTATFFIPDIMSSINFLGFPLHYFLTAVGGPLGALILSFLYARKRDQMDKRYGITHGASDESSKSTSN